MRPAFVRLVVPVFLLPLLLVGCRAGDLSLPPRPGIAVPGNIYGRVLYARPGLATRQPAAGASIELLGTSLATLAGADGSFLLEGIVQEQGRLLVRFDSDGDGLPDRQRLIALEEIHAGPGRQIGVGDVAVVENARMHGRILLGDRTDKPGGHGNTTVYVPAGPFTTVTNDDGSWSLAELPEGRVSVSFFHLGYEPLSFDDLDLRSGEDFAARELVLVPQTAPPPAGAIAGKIVFSPAVADATGTVIAAIDATGHAAIGEASADGTFHVRELPVGLYDLTVARDGYATAVVRHILIASGEQVVLPQVVLQAGSGTLVCTPGDPCTPRTPCRAGTIDCSSGAPRCDESGPASDGTVCGIDQVCRAGACADCAAGGACAPEESACHEGVWTCRTGVRLCEDRGTNRADGLSCGAGSVCNTGACVACPQGSACRPDGSSCHTGAIECSSGSPVCRDTLANADNGAACGEGRVCNGGSCILCAAGSLCTPTNNACHAGAFSCNTGVRICVDSGTALEDGTGCGEDLVCRTGGCTGCRTGAACAPPAAPCHAGLTSCLTGLSVCEDTAANAEEGTPCGTGLVCHTGACVPSGFSLVSGNDTSAPVARAGAPVTLRLADRSGAPLAGVAIAVVSPAGGGATPASGSTNAQGRFTFSPRMPRAPGTFTWTASAAGQGQIAATATATAAAAGTLFTVVDADHSSGNDGSPGAGPLAHIGVTYGLAVTTDGTLYFSDATNHLVHRLSPAGGLNTVAGAGGYGPDGDGLDALDAHLNTPMGVAFDEQAQVLYFSDSGTHRVRAVELASGLISTVIGGGSAVGPGYGDDGPGPAAVLATPTHLALGPDGLLYVTDRGHNRIRRWDPATGLVSAWFAADSTACTVEPVVAYGCGSGPGCQVVFDTAGDAFISAWIAGTSVGASCAGAAGVVRRDQVTGALSHIAGNTAGSTAEGRPATDAVFSEAPALALGTGDDVYTLDPVAHVLRRVEGATGRITTVAGKAGQSGWAADGVTLALARFSSPSALVADAASNLHVADTQNFAIRTLAGAAGAPVSPARLSVATGNGQSVLVGQAAPIPLGAKLVDGEGAPLVGYAVQWKVIDAGGGIHATSSRTNTSGVASVLARAGRTPGAWRFEASFQDLGGHPATDSPVRFTLTAAAPPAGTVHTLLNLDHTNAQAGNPGPGPMARMGSPGSLALAQDGTVYVTDVTWHRVLRLSPGGLLTTLAGTGYGYGYTGDGGSALEATFSGPLGLALDETQGALYVADSGNHVVRRIGLADGTITTVAGGGTAPGPGYGDGGPATAASLLTPTHLALGPDGALYVTDRGHDRIRRVDLESGVITSWFVTTGAYCTTTEAANVYSCGGGAGCHVAWDAAGDAYISGHVYGTQVGSNCAVAFGLVRRARDTGELTHLAGSPTGATLDGRPATETKLSSPPVSAVDKAGNVLLLDADAHVLRRIEAATRRMTTLAGRGSAGYAGDWAPMAGAVFDSPWDLELDGAGNLYLADRNNFAVRTIAGGAAATTGSAQLSVASGDGQTALVDQTPARPFAVKLVDGGGLPLAGYTVSWKSVDAGAALYATTSRTDTAGIASVLGRAGRLTGSHRFQASYLDLQGNAVTGSPASFTLTATAPNAGDVFTVVNVDRTQVDSGSPGPATLAHLVNPSGLAAAADGTLYFSDQGAHKVLKLTPAGQLTTVAGTGAGGYSGDGGPATSAQLYGPVGLALDAAANVLYVAEYYNQDVRRIDLGTGTITTYAGGGSAGAPGYGDGGPASNATFAYPTWLVRGPDGALYVTDQGHDRIRRIDPESSVITTWQGSDTNYCTLTDAVILYSCGTGGCHLTFDAAGNGYISGTLYGTSLGDQCQGSFGVARRDKVTGALTLVAGHYEGSGAENIVAPLASFASAPGLVFDASANLLLIDTTGHRIRRIDLTTTRISTVAGNGVAGFAGDYRAAAQTQWNGPTQGVLLPGGHLAFTDYGNACVRELW